MKLIKSTSKDFQTNRKSRPQIYTSMKRCRTACQIGNTVNYVLCLVPWKRAYKNHYLVKSRFKRKLGLTSFTSLKPSFVKKVRQTPLRGCKCEYCQNLGLLHESMIGIGFKGIPKNHSCSIETTWCKFWS